MVCLDILPMEILILNLVLAKDGVLRIRLHRNSTENYTDENKSPHNILILLLSIVSSNKNILDKNAWKCNNYTY
jgi:hypothetical protein